MCLVAALGVCAFAGPLPLAAAPGLSTVADGYATVRPAPRVFFDRGEGFVPTSAEAGLEWRADLQIHRTGDYRFFVAEGELRIDGVVVGPDPVRLQAGLRVFHLDTPRPPGPAFISVDWEGPGFLREPIPARHFDHGDSVAGGSDGRRLFEDLGCSNCHHSDSPSIQRRPGPVLTGLGGRRKPEWIRHWLDSPASFRSWATMPAQLSATQITDVAAFLASLADPPLEEPRIRGAHVERGRSTFQVFGCVACHDSDLALDGLGSKMTAARLQQYLLDPIRYSPDGRMPSFHLSEAEALELAAHLVESRNDAFERPVPSGDPARGRQLVAASGCLSCHQLEGLESEASAPRLGALRGDLGCLSESPGTGIPRYRLRSEEREALRGFVSAYRASPDAVPAPTFDLPRRLAQLRCNACHELDGAPPSGALAEAAPPLTGVGEKLRPEFTNSVLQSETRTLDWQELRMPGFGEDHALWLADALAKASGVDPVAAESVVVDGSRDEGRDRLGVDGSQGGMGCIGCHGWGEFPSLGENGPDLFAAGRRLRGSWFRRWMLDPPRILAGTSMPSYFAGHDTPDSREAIGDLWAALRAAEELQPPFGFRTEDSAQDGEARPVPVDKAIVIRWDMPEATPAAIAVGLPGGISYCFDAGESRLRYAWRDGFVDMTPTLFAKKNPATNLTETAAIVGEIFFREGAYPIRVDDRDRIPQRRFRGYRLVDSVPEFRYEVDGVAVRERIDRNGAGLVRRFLIPRVDRPMWFVPAEAEGIDVESTLPNFEIPMGENVAFEVTVVEAR